jgi:hypothetical protein
VSCFACHSHGLSSNADDADVTHRSSAIAVHFVCKKADGKHSRRRISLDPTVDSLDDCRVEILRPRNRVPGAWAAEAPQIDI